ncbi:MAG: flagellar biosynthesis anti-sigma factor FlgM [Phycisphaerales bacterium]|nr:flagellar biosynthesis anti-sigma factor FlgM [Phycisphaerales bacterium]
MRVIPTMTQRAGWEASSRGLASSPVREPWMVILDPAAEEKTSSPKEFAMPHVGNVSSVGLSSNPAITAATAARRFAGTNATERTASAPSESVIRGEDRVEVSDTARWMSELRSMPDVRADKVAAAREAIARGDFDTDERLAVAIERIIEDLD